MRLQEHLQQGQDFFGPTPEQEAATAALMEQFYPKYEAESVSRPGEPAAFPEGEDLDSLLQKAIVESSRLQEIHQDEKLIARQLLEFINTAAPDVDARIGGVDGSPDSVMVTIFYVLGGGIDVYSNVVPYSGIDDDE